MVIPCQSTGTQSVRHYIMYNKSTIVYLPRILSSLSSTYVSDEGGHLQSFSTCLVLPASASFPILSVKIISREVVCKTETSCHAVSLSNSSASFRRSGVLLSVQLLLCLPLSSFNNLAGTGRAGMTDSNLNIPCKSTISCFYCSFRFFSTLKIHEQIPVVARLWTY